VTGDCRIELQVDEETAERTFIMRSRSAFASKTSLNGDLLDFLHDLQEKVRKTDRDFDLQVFTQQKRGDTIFHGHPNYRGKGIWRDWAVVDWGRGYGNLPAHIACFVDLEDQDGLPSGPASIDFGGIKLQQNVYAVIESSTYEQEEDAREDAIFVPIRKEIETLEDGLVTKRRFFLADTSAIVAPCCCIPDLGGPPNRYFLVHSRPEWSKMFQRWLDLPHNQDVISDDEVSSSSQEDEDEDTSVENEVATGGGKIRGKRKR